MQALVEVLGRIITLQAQSTGDSCWARQKGEEGKERKGGETAGKVTFYDGTNKATDAITTHMFMTWSNAAWAYGKTRLSLSR